MMENYLDLYPDSDAAIARRAESMPERTGDPLSENPPDPTARQDKPSRRRVFYPTFGQCASPLALIVNCPKHGASIWAVCDCSPRFFSNVHALKTSPDSTQEDDIYSRRDDFASIEAAARWGKQEAAKLNKEYRYF